MQRKQRQFQGTAQDSLCLEYGISAAVGNTTKMDRWKYHLKAHKQHFIQSEYGRSGFGRSTARCFACLEKILQVV